MRKRETYRGAARAQARTLMKIGGDRAANWRIAWGAILAARRMSAPARKPGAGNVQRSSEEG